MLFDSKEVSATPGVLLIGGLIFNEVCDIFVFFHFEDDFSTLMKSDYSKAFVDGVMIDKAVLFCFIESDIGVHAWFYG